MQDLDNPGATIEAPEAESDQELEGRGGYFPRRYLTDLFGLLARRGDLFAVHTYADLDWAEADEPEAFYPAEFNRWQTSLIERRRDPEKIHLLIQYDVDSSPERTMGLVAEPSHRSIPANIMLFNRRIDRRRLARTGEVGFTGYDIDDALLQRLERERFVIGYHINAFEQARFDPDEAVRIMAEDVAALRRRFAVRFVSAHGGVPGPDKRNNRDLPYPQALRRDLIWVHNGRSPRYFKTFSDGGHNSGQRDPRSRDLRQFVLGMVPGRRYRILLHPQYYAVDHRPSRRFAGTPWYDQLMADAEAPGTPSLWAAVERELERRPPRPVPVVLPAPFVAVKPVVAVAEPPVVTAIAKCGKPCRAAGPLGLGKRVGAWLTGRRVRARSAP